MDKHTRFFICGIMVIMLVSALIATLVFTKDRKIAVTYDPNKEAVVVDRSKVSDCACNYCACSSCAGKE